MLSLAKLSTLLAIFAPFTSSLALPVDSKLAVRDDTIPEVAVLQTLYTNINTIITKTEANPGTYFTQTSAAFSHMSSDIADATAGIQALPTSTDPVGTIIASDGPLVKTLTNTILRFASDMEVLSQNLFNGVIPNYTNETSEFDYKLYQLVGSLNAKYQGFTSSLADAIGADTAVGKILNDIGGNTFALLFDGIGGTTVPGQQG